jgi:hypothetical protein
VSCFRWRAAVESRIFQLDRPTIPRLYISDTGADEMQRELEVTARNIVSLLITMKEYPHIRYNNTQQQFGGKKMCKALAAFVQVCVCARARAGGPHWW